MSLGVVGWVHRAGRQIVALAAAGGVMLALSACGGEADRTVAIATVDGVPIRESQLVSWFPALAPPFVRSVDPLSAHPDLAECLRLTRPSGGSIRNEGDAARGDNDNRRLTSKCADSVSAARAETLGFLIRSVWIAREAERRNVALTGTERRRAVEERAKGLQAGLAMSRYLDATGMTPKTFRQRVVRDALTRKLLFVIEAPRRSVSSVDAKRFYRQHSVSFMRPVTREIHVVVTRKVSVAQRARDQLEAGRGWKPVVSAFSIDSSKQRSGRTTIDMRNAIPKLRRIVFAAPQGRLVGPVEIRGVWWVFRVDRELPRRQLGFREVESRIRASVRSTREQLAFDRMMAYLTRRYQPRTVCQDGHTARECGKRSAAAVHSAP